jgi:mono/diheme cytochrome c family protein
MRPAGVAALLVLAAAAAAAGSDAAGVAGGTDQLAPGKALYEQRCAICHGPGGTGTFMLARRLGAEKSQLAARTDLTPQLIQWVARHGIGSMPLITRAEVTDAELGAIVAYLTRPESARGADH